MSSKKLFKGLAIATITLGAIHTLATPLVLGEFGQLSMGSLLVFIYMFMATGIAMILTGSIQLVCLRGIENNRGFSRILGYTVAFIALSGFGAVATMFDNPFAYLTLLVALGQLFTIRRVTASAPAPQ